MWSAQPSTGQIVVHAVRLGCALQQGAALFRSPSQETRVCVPRSLRQADCSTGLCSRNWKTANCPTLPKPRPLGLLGRSSGATTSCAADVSLRCLPPGLSRKSSRTVCWAARRETSCCPWRPTQWRACVCQRGQFGDRCWPQRHEQCAHQAPFAQRFAHAMRVVEIMS